MTKDDNRVDFDKLWQKISKGVGQLSEKDKGLSAVKRVYRAEDNFDAAAKVPLEAMPGARRKAKTKGNYMKETFVLTKDDIDDIIGIYLDEYEGVSEDSIIDIRYIINDTGEGFALDIILVEYEE